MLYCFINIVNSLDSHSIVHKFCAKRNLCSLFQKVAWITLVEESVSTWVSIYLYVERYQQHTEGRQVLEAVLMYYEAVKSIANADSASLGIDDDTGSHIKVRILIPISMYHTSTSFDNRYLSIIAYEVDELSSASWYADINISHSRQHLGSCLMGSRQQLNTFSITTTLGDDILNQGNDSLVRLISIMSTFQYASIATFEAEREDVKSHIRTSLEYHTDDTERNRNLLQFQTVRKSFLAKHPVQWRG